MIQREDIFNVANSINMRIDEDYAEHVMDQYHSASNPDEMWNETVERLLYENHTRKEMELHQAMEDTRPNPIDYEDSPEGDAQYWNDYWGGDFDAMIYHDDIGDR